MDSTVTGNREVAEVPGVDEEPFSIDKTVRFAAFTLGGVVVLAIGVMMIADALGPVLQSVFMPPFPGGLNAPFYFFFVPAVGAGAVLVGVAMVLLLLGRSIR